LSEAWVELMAVAGAEETVGVGHVLLPRGGDGSGLDGERKQEAGAPAQDVAACRSEVEGELGKAALGWDRREARVSRGR
jgi:hypothetical protein